MRSTRLLVGRLSVEVVGGAEDGRRVSVEAGDIAYADLFVVVREGEAAPGPNDWEVTLQTRSVQHLRPGEHDLRIEARDGTVLTGRALLRYSDGTRHLFRGDGTLTGFAETP